MVVMRDSRQHRLDIAGANCDERICDAAVQTQPIEPRDLVVQRFANQCVREAIFALHIAAPFDDARLGSGLEMLEHSREVIAEGGADLRSAKYAPDHRSRDQNLIAALGQPI